MTKFVYKVLAEVQFTREELEILLVLSKHHYDGHCRSVSEVGGFLYGIKNGFKFAPEIPHHLKFREIDTLCKILEMSDTLSPIQSLLEMNKPQLLKVAAALATRLHQMLRDINAETARLNPD